MAITGATYTSRFHTTTYPFIDPAQPHLSTAGKTVLVTGGGSGIGAEIARSFAQSSASNLVITGRTEATLARTADLIRAAFPKTKVHSFVADITDAVSVESLFAAVIKDVGPVDVLVNNAGYMAAPTFIKDTKDLKDWWKDFEANVLGTTLVTRAYLVTKSATRTGVVIDVNTLIAHYGNFAGFSAYAASKMAALRIVDSLVAENPEVRFFSIHPGAVDTPMYEKSGLPRAGFTDPSLPADVCVWLVNPEASFLSGRLLWVNWDLEEILGKQEEIVERKELVMSLRGIEGDLQTMLSG